MTRASVLVTRSGNDHSLAVLNLCQGSWRRVQRVDEAGRIIGQSYVALELRAKRLDQARFKAAPDARQA
jgi:hypothetical protein